MLSSLAIISFLFALVPALLFRANLRAYTPLPCPPAGLELPPVSVLIPARNEEAAIGDAVQAALLNKGVVLEVIVLDDHSEDRTAAIVEQFITHDGRVRLVTNTELPSGWCGKQHACWLVAKQARYPLLLFIDADVRLAPDALARMAAFVSLSGTDLGSGIPRQETVGLLEKMTIPLIHFILLGFLPIARMRRSRQPAFAAGCGQLFIARASAYQLCGGHSAIRDTLHDGLKLPRVFRAAGFKTDLFDATDLAACRMYRNARELWSGLAKNAGEALAAPAMIGPMTAILLGGQVVPGILLLLAICSWPAPWPLWRFGLALFATAATIYPRLAAASRYRQSLPGAILHPSGILVLVAIQWYAFVCNLLGRRATWKGRSYTAPRARSKAIGSRELEPTA